MTHTHAHTQAPWFLKVNKTKKTTTKIYPNNTTMSLSLVWKMCQTTHNKTGPCPALQNAVITSETPFPLPFQIPPHNAHESKVYYCHCLNCWSLDIIAVFLISQGVVEIFVICIFPPYFTTFLMLFPPTEITNKKNSTEASMKPLIGLIGRVWTLILTSFMIVH